MEQIKWDVILSAYIHHKDALQCFMSIPRYNHELYRHSTNVAFYSTIIGGAYYQNTNDLKELFLAALFHDIGKLKIPRELLDKPDKLTADERRIIEQHPLMGYVLLQERTNLPERILNGVLDHHERVNGSGYNGKQGNDISDYAKIISVADVYDAMTSNRVYHKSFPQEIVCNYLYSNAGDLFEKKLVDYFTNHIFDIDNDQQKIKFRNILKDKILEEYSALLC